MASQSCAGALEFVDGGVIRDASVIGGNITRATIQSSTFEAGTINTLQEIDAQSALVIAKAIGQLDPDILKDLAAAILKAAKLPEAESAPEKTEGDVPRNHFGKGTAMLGEPDKWVALGDGAVPLYR